VRFNVSRRQRSNVSTCQRSNDSVILSRVTEPTSGHAVIDRKFDEIVAFAETPS
jgi:hypothetical protein